MDDISDPDEDTPTGQRAAMRGESMKKIRSEDDRDSTDDDKESSVDSHSDSHCILSLVLVLYRESTHHWIIETDKLSLGLE